MTLGGAAQLVTAHCLNGLWTPQLDRPTHAPASHTMAFTPQLLSLSLSLSFWLLLLLLLLLNVKAYWLSQHVNEEHNTYLCYNINTSQQKLTALQ